MKDKAHILKTAERIAGISVIFLLSIGVIQLIFGSFYSNSVSLFANGIDCIGDSFVSLILWVGMKYIRRPADNKFHYGYYKIENFNSIIAAFVMFILASYIVYRSYIQFNTPHEIESPLTGAAIAIIAAIGAWALGIVQYRIGKSQNLNSVKLEGLNTIKDGTASFLVVIGLLLSAYGYSVADAIMGFVIAGIIISIGFASIKEASFFLVDACDYECMDKGQVIRQIAQEQKEVEVAKLIKLRRSGPVTMGELEIEVSGELSVNEIEKIRIKIDKIVKKRFNDVETLTIIAKPFIEQE